MPGPPRSAVAFAAKRVPGLKRLPILQLLAAAEVLLLAYDHVTRLDASERRRVVELVRRGKGMPSNLSSRDQEELRVLVAKAEPRLFVGRTVQRLSPIPIPARLVAGVLERRA